MEWFICYWAFAALVMAGSWAKARERPPLLVVVSIVFAPVCFPLDLGHLMESANQRLEERPRCYYPRPRISRETPEFA